MGVTYLGLMLPFAFKTRCHGTLSLWNAALFLLRSVDGLGRCFKQTPTCL
jgi:hypothetical protein